MNKIWEKLNSFKERIGIIREFLDFLWKQKIWWMIPLFLMLILIGFLILFAETSAFTPFVYTVV